MTFQQKTSQNTNRFRKIVLTWFFVLVGTLVFAAYLANVHYSKECRQDNSEENFTSAINSCVRARQFAWFFQLLEPLKYTEILNEAGLAETMQYKFDDAKRDLLYAIDRYKDSRLEGSNNYARTLNNLGLLNLYIGDLAQQKYWYGQANSLFEKLDSHCDEVAASSNSSLGHAMIFLGESEDAEILLSRRAKQNSNCPSISPYLSAFTLRALGEAQNENENYEEALESLTMAIQKIEGAGRKMSLEMAYSLTSRAISLKNLERYQESVRDIEAGLPLLEKFLGPDSVPAGTANGALGNALRAQGKNEEAIRKYAIAEKIYRNRLHPDHPRLATILLQKARALGKRGQKAEALTALRESLRIRTKAFGEKSLKVIAVKEEIENLDT